jgi:hypothetical protein
MALSPLDFIVLAVVAFKVTGTLLFLLWLMHEPQRTEATDMYNSVQAELRRGITMALSPLDYIILIVVMFKIIGVLFFLRWLANEPQRTEATDIHDGV